MHADVENEVLLQDVRFSNKEYAMTLCGLIILHKPKYRRCSAKLSFSRNVPWNTEHDFPFSLLPPWWQL